HEDYEHRWQDFLTFCGALTEDTGLQLQAGLSALLYSVKAQWDALELRITPPNKFSADRLALKDINENLRCLLKAFSGKTPELRFLPPPEVLNERADIKETVEKLPIMQALKDQLGASLVDYGPWHK
ncbi:MAG: hypothetical protein LBV76_00900, partial [Deltaproteobacteria bacterium]|nr:hypothetical protein [Deltaproteobacteria bacterium]